MTTMNSAPLEVWNLTIQKLRNNRRTGTRDLQNMRLVCKAFSAQATTELFSRVYIHLWQFDRDRRVDEEIESMIRLRNIIAEPRLRDLVRHVIVRTKEDPNLTAEVVVLGWATTEPLLREAICLSSE